MRKEDREEIGKNVLFLFENNPFLLEKGYRLTKTKDRNIERPINQFKKYYEETGKTEFSREVVENEILVKADNEIHSGSDPVGTGLRTMKDFLFLDKVGNNYFLSYQFFDWINSEELFYDYFINQVINIRELKEIKGIYNGLLCMFREWILNGEILDFSSITDEKFIEKVKSKRKRVQYCKFVENIYGFSGDKRKKADPKEGNYCPDILQRVRTVFLRTNIIERMEEDSKEGFKKYTLSSKGIKLLEIINNNLFIILNNEDLDNCYSESYSSEKENDAPKIKKEKKEETNEREKTSHPITSKSIKDNAKNAANYLCEIEIDVKEKNKLFIEKSTNKNYVEGHHLIPMKYYDLFQFDLDVEANVVCVCPSCHRLLHYGLDEERKDIIKRLYEKRKERLEKCKLLQLKDGSEVSLEVINSFYKIGDGNE